MRSSSNRKESRLLPTTTMTTAKQEAKRNLPKNGINEQVRLALNAITDHAWYREQTLPEFRNKYLSRPTQYRADKFCKEMNTMVEYNGPFHYQRSCGDRTINDVLKRRFCRHNEIVQINVNPVIPKGNLALQSYLAFRLYTEVQCYAEYLERYGASTDVAIARGRTFALMRDETGAAVEATTVNTVPSLTSRNTSSGGGGGNVLTLDPSEISGYFSPAECEFVEGLVNSRLRSSFYGAGRHARFARLFTVADDDEDGGAAEEDGEAPPIGAGDYAAYSLKYDQSTVCAIDTRSMMELKPANVVYIVFWKRFPRVKYLFYRTDVIHVPLFLLKPVSMGRKPFPLVEYLVCRILDQVDDATVYWKSPHDPSSRIAPSLLYRYRAGGAGRGGGHK